MRCYRRYVVCSVQHKEALCGFSADGLTLCTVEVVYLSTGFVCVALT